MTIFSRSRPSSPSHHYCYGPSSPVQNSSPSTPRTAFSPSMMEEIVYIAESVIRKWRIEEDSSSYSKIDSLFDGDRREAKEFLRSVKDLQGAMNFFVSNGSNSDSEKLVRAQNLMQSAMKRLEKEFYQILSANRNYIDRESVSSRSSRASASISDFEDEASVEDVIQFRGDSVPEVAGDFISELVMLDLKIIADTMISSGYSKECVKIYNLVRKLIVEESLYYLGVEKLGSSNIQKLDWEMIEIKIKHWFIAVKIAVETIFLGERILSDVVFSASPRISESCFTEIARENAMTLFRFPERVAKYKKLSPEKIFRVLDIYDTISILWPDISSIFSFESMLTVRLHAVNSLVKIGDAIRAKLSEFENAIQKGASKTPIPGGGIHPLTRYVMNYVVLLSDYSGTLSDIANSPPSMQSPLPETYFASPTSLDDSESAISVRLAWIILLLLCKLDGKAELYKDVALSYLFLANNLNYVVSKVRSSNLNILLGDVWLENHEAKVKQYTLKYERMGWSIVISSLPELNSTDDIAPAQVARECFRNFNSSFEEAYRKQTTWVVPDPKLRDEIKVSLAKKFVPAYTTIYEKYRWMFTAAMGDESLVRYAPDDLGNYLSDLFYSTGASGSVSSSVSSTSHSRWRKGH